MGLFDSVGSGGQDWLSQRALIGQFFDPSEQNAMNALGAAPAGYQNLQTPNLQAQTYNPQAYNYQTVSQDPTIKSAQMSYLNKLAGLSDTGLSAVDEANYARAGQLANQQYAGNQAAALQNAQARGVAGGGLEFALKEQADQNASTNQNNANLQQAATSAQQRALYNQAYGNALNQQQQQQTGLSKTNADIINQFNQLNTGNQNQAQLYNQQYPNQLAQQNYQNQLSRLGGLSNANQALAQGYAAQNAANTSGRNQDTKTLMSGLSFLGG